MTVVKDATKSVAKLSGKKKKTSLKVRDHGQEEGEVSDKSVIFAARNITCEHMSELSPCHQRKKSVEYLFWFCSDF